MFSVGRAPIASPPSDDCISKLQTTLNNIIHCVTDALHILPETAPVISSSMDILGTKEELTATKCDILYRANYIGSAFECLNTLIEELASLKPLIDTDGEIFIEKVESLKRENEMYNKTLHELTKECEEALIHIKKLIRSQVNDSINKQVEELYSNVTMESAEDIYQNMREHS
ncbi:hypothetical protein ACR3K2_04390 [Cryptosporidium serpentis]